MKSEKSNRKTTVEIVQACFDQWRKTRSKRGTTVVTRFFTLKLNAFKIVHRIGRPSRSEYWCRLRTFCQ